MQINSHNHPDMADRTPTFNTTMSTLAHNPSTSSYPSTSNVTSLVRPQYCGRQHPALRHSLGFSSFHRQPSPLLSVQDQTHAIVLVAPSGPSVHHHPLLLVSNSPLDGPRTSLYTTPQHNDCERGDMGRLRPIPHFKVIYHSGAGRKTSHGGDTNNNGEHSRTSERYPKSATSRSPDCSTGSYRQKD